MYLEEVTIQVPVRQIIIHPGHHQITVHHLHHQAAAVRPAVGVQVPRLENFNGNHCLYKNLPMSKTSHDRPLPFTDNYKLVI